MNIISVQRSMGTRLNKASKAILADLIQELDKDIGRSDLSAVQNKLREIITNVGQGLYTKEMVSDTQQHTLLKAFLYTVEASIFQGADGYISQPILYKMLLDTQVPLTTEEITKCGIILNYLQDENIRSASLENRIMYCILNNKCDYKYKVMQVGSLQQLAELKLFSSLDELFQLSSIWNKATLHILPNIFNSEDKIIMTEEFDAILKLVTYHSDIKKENKLIKIFNNLQQISYVGVEYTRILDVSLQNLFKVTTYYLSLELTYVQFDSEEDIPEKFKDGLSKLDLALSGTHTMSTIGYDNLSFVIDFVLNNLEDYSLVRDPSNSLFILGCLYNICFISCNLDKQNNPPSFLDILGVRLNYHIQEIKKTQNNTATPNLQLVSV